MAKSYIDLLKDPRWQKKRLEILSLDYWQCRACSSKTGTLHVHHLWYERGKNPWEYDNKALITLCERCHEQAKKINWRQAFLDLNMSEKELLEIAIQLHFLKAKWTGLTKDIQEKYKTRFYDLSIHVPLLQESEDVDLYFQVFRGPFLDKYIEDDGV